MPSSVRLVVLLLVCLSVFPTPSRAQIAPDLPPIRTDSFCEVERVLASADFSAAMWAEPTAPIWGLPVPEAAFVRVTSPARVFATNPGSSQPIEVNLPGLIGDGTVLDGEFVRSGSDRLDGAGVLAASASKDFRFDPDTTGAVFCPTDLSACSPFDAVNVYYHVDRYARQYWEDVMGLDISFRAEARVHVGGDASFADWSTRSIKFAVGDIFMKNMALSDEIIQHEYNHLVMASLGFEAGSGVTDQVRALHEAYADYFSASWNGDPDFGEWVVTCPPRQQCQGPPNDRELRTLDLDPEAWNWRQGQPSDTLRYGICTRYHEGDGKCKQSWNNNSDAYVWAMIWGGALWEMRTRLGPDISDAIALHSVSQFDSGIDFARAFDITVESAEQLHGPNVRGEVEQVFLERGFASATDIERGSAPTAAHLEVWPNPAWDQLHVRWEAADARSGGVRWVLHDMLGRSVRSGRMDHHDDLQVDLAGLPAGLYRISVLASSGTAGRLIVRSR